MTDPEDAFPLLLGRWRLVRSVPDQATMHGEATLTLQQPGGKALYSEQVTIHTATGHHLTGSAHYTFTRRQDALVDVHLHTGTLFHTLRFVRTPAGHLQAHATHPCAADLYTSTYRILSPDHLVIEHQVTGPRKHHTITTTLTRST